MLKDKDLFDLQFEGIIHTHSHSEVINQIISHHKLKANKLEMLCFTKLCSWTVSVIALPSVKFSYFTIILKWGGVRVIIILLLRYSKSTANNVLNIEWLMLLFDCRSFSCSVSTYVVEIHLILEVDVTENCNQSVSLYHESSLPIIPLCITSTSIDVIHPKLKLRLITADVVVVAFFPMFPL